MVTHAPPPIKRSRLLVLVALSAVLAGALVAAAVLLV
jgi:hypothetical protein